MSVLNGGLPKRANVSVEDFVAEFIDHITPDEWRIVAQLPNLRHVLELVTVVLEIRTTPRWPLPADHPLNPAHRFAAVSA